MQLANGWVIADKSMYGNFTRFRKDSVDSYIWYTGNERDTAGAVIKNQNHITVFTNGNEHKIYYKNKTILLEEFNKLEKIMWEYNPGNEKCYIKD